MEKWEKVGNRKEQTVNKSYWNDRNNVVWGLMSFSIEFCLSTFCVQILLEFLQRQAAPFIPGMCKGIGSIH